MKKFITLLAGTFFAFLIVNGCKKVVPTSTSDNTVSAVIDSNIFNATGTSVTASRNGYQLVLTAITPDNVKITLSVNNFTGFDEQTDIDGYSGTASIDSGKGPVASIINGKGYVNFTETYPYVKGTFAFTCTDSSHVTHGKFYVVAPAK